MVAFSIISQHWDGAGTWNLSLWMTRAYLFCKVNNIVTDGLVMWGAMASTATVLILNIPASAVEGVNTLRPRQYGRHFPDDIFKRIFLNEHVWILLKTSLKFVPKVQINNIPALVLMMAWRRPGDKPLSEPMMISLLTHICITRPQCVNSPLSLFPPLPARRCRYTQVNWAFID